MASRYHFHHDHPFHPIRLALTEQLLRASNAWDQNLVITPQWHEEARELIQEIHRPDYVSIVSALSDPNPSTLTIENAEQYGLEADGDTPYFIHLDQVSTALAAGSITAVEEVMSGRADRVLHLSGGLHHAFPNRASGFCVYNDAAAAITWIRKKYNARVMYIDTDVHHGDGVQWFFYTDPDVFTLSIHETGKFLFPGTGFHHERGDSTGYGACLNLPVEPYTEDDSWLECFNTAVHKAVQQFKPDIIISQHGCDAHAYDPLAHIECSMRIYREMPRIIHQLANQYTDGRWVALGGGGYDHWRVVPRAWSLLWLEMCDHPLLEQIDTMHCGGELPPSWIDPSTSIHRPTDISLPTTWLDHVAQWTPMVRRDEISSNNKTMLDIALQHL